MNRPIAIITALSVTVTTAAVLAERSKEAGSKSPIRVSKETTRVDGPLRKDGAVDYVAAINKRRGEGVTSENNAAVLMLRAFGAAVIPKKFRESTYKQLGMQPLPDRGRYFKSMRQYVADRQSLIGVTEEQLHRNHDDAMKSAWSPRHFPHLNNWLRLNKTPLNLIVEATTRKRYFIPTHTDAADIPLFSVGIDAPFDRVAAARLLCLRALRKLGGGSNDGALADLDAAHRLAQIIHRDPTLIDVLKSYSVFANAWATEVAVLNTGLLTPKQIQKRLQDLQGAAPLPTATNAVDTWERFTFLDAVCSLLRTDGNENPPLGNSIGKLIVEHGVDWNEILIRGNKIFDRVVSGMKLSTHAERLKAADEIEGELKRLRDETGEENFLRKLISGGKPAITRHLGNHMICLLVPSVQQASTVQTRTQSRRNMLEAAYALEAYQLQHNEYPDSLSKLTPAFLNRVPTDDYNGQPLAYERKTGGYLLYSGNDLKDDGGSERGDLVILRYK